MKRPAFQFYPGDWLRDTALRSCSVGARGLWIDLLCFMHDGDPYGHLAVAGVPLRPQQLAHMVGIPHARFIALLRELERAKVLSRSKDGAIYSRRMVRDEELREKRGAGGHESTKNPNATRRREGLKGGHEGPLKGGHEGPHHGGGEGGDGRTPPASASAVASAVSQLHEAGASRRAETPSPNGDGPTFGALMGLVRQHLYAPDGRSPRDWDESRDGSILKQILKHRRADDVAIAIEGLALLRDHPGAFADAVDWLTPGGKVTLKALYNTRSGVLSTFELAHQAYWKRENTRGDRGKPGAPMAIGDLLPQAAPR